MKKKLSILFLLLNTLAVLSQKITIKDNTTGKALPLVRINYILNNSIENFDYSNEKGEFTVQKDNQFDSLEFIYLGYENKFLIKSDLNNQVNLFLTPTVYQLNEVIVTKKNDKAYNYGYAFEKKSSEFWLMQGSIYCVFISNSLLKEQLIKDVKFSIGSKVKQDNFVLKLHFYKSIDGKPKEELNYGNLFHKIKKGSNGVIDINIENRNIIFPKEGICIGLELIYSNNLDISEKKIFYRNECLILNMFKNNGEITFTKGATNNKWYKLNKKKFNEPLSRFDLMIGVNLIDILEFD